MKNYRKDQFTLAVLLEVKEEARRNGEIVLAAEKWINVNKVDRKIRKN